MQLLVFRHGIAEDDSAGGSDFSRQLTDEGVDRTRRAAAGLRKVAPSPQVILTSPKVRARQTADLAGEAFDRSPVIENVLAEDNAVGIVNMLRKRREQTVMIVGHEPTLSTVIEMLCAPNRPHPFVRMKKAGCALVDVDLDAAGIGSGGQLEWLLPPKALRKLV